MRVRPVYYVCIFSIAGLTLLYKLFWFVEVHRHHLGLWPELDPGPGSSAVRSLTENTKTVLLYTRFFEWDDWFCGDSKACTTKPSCPETDCLFTRDPYYHSDFGDFDAVVIHLQNARCPFMRRGLFSSNRKPHQRFIAFLAESPLETYFHRYAQFNNFFNWTATYRRDSDIVFRYGEFLKQPQNSTRSRRDSENLYEAVAKKKKQVLWMVSHCSTTSEREVYVAELQKYIQVDIVGKCGQDICKTGHNCEGPLFKDYKFYLAFENSICKDYMTEKFFSKAMSGLLPIVMGSGDYASVAPPKSYLHVDDFDSPQKLAEYLLYLNNNISAYMEYFQWYDQWTVKSEFSILCDVCTALHQASPDSHKTYKRLDEWFHTDPQSGDQICQARGSHPWSKYRQSHGICFWAYLGSCAFLCALLLSKKRLYKLSKLVT